MSVSKYWKLALVAMLSSSVGVSVGKYSASVPQNASDLREPSTPLGLVSSADPTTLVTLEQIRKAAPEELPILAQRIDEGKYYDLPTLLARRELIRSWIESDAEEAYRYFAEGEARQLGQQEFAREWAKIDPDGFASFALERNERELFRSGAWELAESRPEIVLSEIEKETFELSPNPLLSSNSLLIRLVKSIAKSSFEDAEAFMEKHRDRPMIMDFRDTDVSEADREPILALANLRLENGFEGAIQWASERENPSERKTLLAFMIAETALNEGDPSGDVYQALASKYGLSASEIALNIVKTKPLAAIEWLQKNADPASAQKAIFQVALEFREPRQIEEAYAMLENESQREKFAMSLLMNWHGRDLESGFEFIQKNSSGKKQSEWLRTFAGGVGGTSFADAYELTEKISDPSDREMFRRTLILDHSDAFPDRALSLAKQTGDTDFYLDVLENSIEDHVYGRSMTIEQCAALLSKLPEDRTAGYASGELAIRWWKEDPEGAVDWVETMPHTGNRRNAIRGLLTEMARDDPERALAFARTRAEPADRQAAVATLVGELGESRPDTLFLMTTTLDPGIRRSNLLKQVVGSWARQAPQIAIDAIRDSSSLSKTEKERLLTRVYSD